MGYAINQLVRCRASFYNGPDTSGALTDPTSVVFKVLDPTGNETDYVWPGASQVVHDGTGLFHVDVLASKSGTWTYRFNGTGAAIGAGERTFVVDPSAFRTP